VYVLQKNYQDAEEEFLKSIEISSDCLLAHFNLGLLYFSSGRTEKAAYHLKKIIDIDPSSDLGQWILAQVFQGQKSCRVVLNCLKRTT